MVREGSHDPAIDRRLREILERRRCDWVEAWALAERSLIERQAAVDADEPAPSGSRYRHAGRVTLSEQIGLAKPRHSGIVAPGRMPLSAGLPAAVMRSAERSEIDPEAAELVTRARGAGAPLDDVLRPLLESALGAGLGNVRVHTGAEADAAARALGARAFAIGDDVFFRDGTYDPRAHDGQRLIAHEVAHTVQARGAAPPTSEAVAVSQPGDALEHEADAFADAFADALVCGVGVSRNPATADPFDFGVAAAESAAEPIARIPVPRVSTAAPAAARMIQRAPGDEKSFPGFSQGGFDSCGAASVVSALMIWDKQNNDPSAPNNLVVNACNILLTHLSNYRTTVIAKLEKLKTGKGETLYNAAKSDLTAIRDLARTPGAKLTETNYQALAVVMYLLYSDKPPGMSKADIGGLLTKLGIGGGKSENAMTFDGLFDTAVLKGLVAGQIAQVMWYAKLGKSDDQGNVPIVNHAFLIGRFNSGDWFVSDQGSSPPTEIITNTLPALKTAIVVASNAGTSSIFTGAPTMQIMGGWTGVQLLGDRGGVDKAAQVVKPGTFLAEVDAGRLTNGDRIVAWDFVARKYDFNAARAALAGTGDNGGLIVEMPQGVFSLYKTNLVSDANLNVTGIDEDDSKDGLLARQIFYGAWLILCSKNACRAQPLKVY